MLIREAQTIDYIAINTINKSDLGYDYPIDKTKNKLSKILELSTDKIFVAEINGKIAGYIHGSVYECTYSDSLKNILALVVSDKYRRQGVASELVKAIETWAKDDGSAGVRLVSGHNREDAHEFYLSRGYRLRKEQKNFIKIF